MVVSPFYSLGSGYSQTYPAEQEEKRQLKNCEKLCIFPELECIEDVLVDELLGQFLAQQYKTWKGLYSC